ncbi:MAG: GDSL-type esterase/lipase family protein, partial [Protaetiibacter sp.]
ADAFLRIRSGAVDVDVANTAATPGAALFEYDLTALPTGSFELLIGSASTGSLAPVDSAIADLGQLLGHAGRSYGFGQASGALRLTVAETPIAVTVGQAQIVSVSGVPTLRVTGTVAGTGGSDAFLRIRTPSVQTVDVPNTATVPGQALFVYDLRGLTSQGAWYDLLTGVTSTGSFADVSSSIANLSQTATANSRSYGFQTWEGALKVAFTAVTATVSPASAQLVDVSGVPTLRVTGTFTNTNNADLFLRVRTGSTTLDSANTATTQGQFSFASDLSALTQPGTWYDLLVGVTSSGSLTNLTPAIATMSQTIDVGDRRYSFQQWSGQLKVSFTDISVTVTPVSAQLLDVAGTPTLRVTGTVTNTVNSDVFLRVRTGSTAIDVPNASTTAGQLSFAFGVGSLSSPGTWYDLLIGVTSKGTLLDLPTSVADLAQTVSKEGRSYTFEQWNGQLKVAYSAKLLGTGESIRIDFGPDDVNDTTRDGNATVSPDVNGRTWNNLSWPNASAAPAVNTSNVVPNGLNAAGLRTTAGIATTTKVTANGTNWLTNGINAGGLLAPNPAYLGEYAIPTVTQDYFFVQSSGTATLTLSGLDPWHEYDLKFFGTRDATGTRTTTYSVAGSNGTQQSVLQVSGTGIGAGGYNGNNNTVVTIENVQPQTDGTLQVKVIAGTGGFGYLGFLEITGDTQLTPPVQVPAEVQRWVSQDAADPLADDSVLFIGSSSIRRWETLTRDFADYNVIQRGWGGSWLSGVNDYSPWVAWPYQPRAIVMWAGTNDLNGGQSAQWVLDEYREFVANMRANSPGSDFFWISITPNPGNVALNSVRMQTNALIKAEIDADASGKLHYIDVASYFENVRDTNPSLFASYYVDNLHMTRSGYAKWLETVRPALEAVAAPNKPLASNAATMQPGEKLFFDFGPSNASEGDPTGVDVNGNHWNNWVPTNGGGLVNVGEHIAGLVDSTGRNTRIGATIAAGFQVNGKTTGGLLTPDAGLLGELGIPSATEDFFYSSADGVWGGSDDDLPGGLMLTGLDPAQEYEFRFFGSRSATDTRVTEYAVYGANSGSAQLQTSGTGISHDGTKNGNDDEVAVVSGVRPDAYGQIWIDLTVIQGSYAYLNAMEVLASPPSADVAVEGLTAFVADEAADPTTSDAPSAEPTEPAVSDEPSAGASEPAADDPARDG